MPDELHDTIARLRQERERRISGAERRATNVAYKLTPQQRVLVEKHGTPEQFETAVWRALGEISVDEAEEAIAKYRREGDQAGEEARRGE
jgi:hypothetical protein